MSGERIEFFGTPSKGTFRFSAPAVLPLVQPEGGPREVLVDDHFPNGRYQHGRYGMYTTIEGHTRAVARCLRALGPVKDTFDGLYVTGMSGIIPAACVAYTMQKELLILRKQNEHGGTDSHGKLLEGNYNKATRLMILDDFVAGAGTLSRLLKYLPSQCKLVGVMLYGHPRCAMEIDVGRAKEFETVEAGITTLRHLIRRANDSMLFDLVKAL